jgi:hypothetical protein
VSNHAAVYRFFTFQYIIKHNSLEGLDSTDLQKTLSLFLERSKYKGAQMYLLVWPILSACQFAYNNYTADGNLRGSLLEGLDTF